MILELKTSPNFHIGEKVKLRNVNMLETYNNDKKKVMLLSHNRFGIEEYYVIDIELTMRLGNGDIKYNYLISTDSEGKSSSTGWTECKNIILL